MTTRARFIAEAPRNSHYVLTLFRSPPGFSTRPLHPTLLKISPCDDAVAAASVARLSAPPCETLYLGEYPGTSPQDPALLSGLSRNNWSVSTESCDFVIALHLCMYVLKVMESIPWRSLRKLKFSCGNFAAATAGEFPRRAEDIWIIRIYIFLYTTQYTAATSHVTREPRT